MAGAQRQQRPGGYGQQQQQQQQQQRRGQAKQHERRGQAKGRGNRGPPDRPPPPIKKQAPPPPKSRSDKPAIELIDGLPVAELAKRMGIAAGPFVKFLNANTDKLEQTGRKFTGNSELGTELLELICLEKDINADVV